MFKCAVNAVARVLLWQKAVRSSALHAPAGGILKGNCVTVCRQFQSEVRLPTGNVEVLLFTDDMVVMSESLEGLQHNMIVMSDVLSKWELKVNWRKSKVIRVARKW